MSEPRPQLPAPAGFGRCAICAYAGLDSPAICFGCACQTVERPLSARRCSVCELALNAGGSCANPVCGWSNRSFTGVRAVCMHSERLRWALARYKSQGRRAWAAIFARMLVGYAGEHRRDLAAPELLLGCPTYVGPGGRSWDHIALILDHAAPRLGWPVGRGVLVKQIPTPALKRCTGWRERLEIASVDIRSSLRVVDPSAVAGRRVLVFDDVFTDGLTLHEVGRVLRSAGARDVRGIVLARQPPGPLAISGQP